MNITTSIVAFDGGVVHKTGGRGPAGPKGDAGAANISVQCGDDITVNRIVYVQDGKCYHADSSSYNTVRGIIGLSTQSVLSGGHVEILAFGKRYDGGFSYPSSGELFLGTDGQLVLSPPSNGVMVHVGYITGQKEIFINIQNPIVLS